MLIRKLFRTAWQYRAQFLSMVIMVAVGIGVFLGFNIEWKSIESDVLGFFGKTNYADFRLYSETGFSEEDVRKIREIDGVDEATRFLSVVVSVKNDDRKTLTLHVSEDYTVSTMLITAGREYDPEADGFWLSDRYAEANGVRVGDTLTLTYMNLEISGEVLGLAKAGEEMICVAGENQLMPDYKTHGFAYIAPAKYAALLGPMAVYPQVNALSGMKKADLEEAVKTALGRTTMVVAKTEDMVYSEAMGESEEGKTMGSILPVLFLAIAVLTMTTTMHRIAANEKVQIGTLKALGFKDRRILAHYTSYGLVIGLVGSAVGVGLGYFIAWFIMNPNGMMGTYFDMDRWALVMPAFCVPVILLTNAFLVFIGFLSVKKMLRGTAAETLRPYQPKTVKKSLIERMPIMEKRSFGTKWNLRDVMRHKARSAMTLVGVLGCMVLLVGGIGMKDTMDSFMRILGDDISNYETRVTIADSAPNAETLALAEELNGDWQATAGVSYRGDTVMLNIYDASHGKIRFVDRNNKLMNLTDDGVYLCLRLKDTAKVGDIIEFSPYGSEETYRVRVAGYTRSVMTECISMTAAYAEEIGVPYHIGSVFTDTPAGEIGESPLFAGAPQAKAKILDTYEGFMEIMNLMIAVLVVAAVVLGIVVLYNLGVMSYVERYRELATLKVLGFRDRQIGRLLISQNIWLTLVGVLIGLPAGVGVLQWLLVALASEYELKLVLGPLTYLVSVGLTFGVSTAVGLMVARKNRKINMVEALKGAE